MQDKTLQEHLYHLVKLWFLNTSELLLKNNKIYVFPANNLYIYIL